MELEILAQGFAYLVLGFCLALYASHENGEPETPGDWVLFTLVIILWPVALVVFGVMSFFCLYVDEKEG